MGDTPFSMDIPMNDFVSKLTLYDILAMVIPGGAIVLLVIMWMPRSYDFPIIKTPEAIVWTIDLVLAYTVGLINVWFTGHIWTYWRNSTDEIYKSLKKLVTEIRNFVYLREAHHYGKMSYKAECPLKSWIIGIMIVTSCIMVLYNTPYLFYWCIALIMAMFVLLNITNVKNVQNKKFLDKYYEAYYFVQKSTYCKNIATIEAQVAFMQSLTIPLFLFLGTSNEKIANYLKGIEAQNLKIAILLLFIALVVYIPCRIKKIYYLVWSDYEYLKRLENQTRHKESHNQIFSVSSLHLPK